MNKRWFGLYDVNGHHVMIDARSIVGVEEKGGTLSVFTASRQWSIVAKAEEVLQAIDDCISKEADGQSG